MAILYSHEYNHRPFAFPIQYLHTRRNATYARRHAQHWLEQSAQYYHDVGRLITEFSHQVLAGAHADLLVQAPSNDSQSDGYFAAAVRHSLIPSIHRHLWQKDHRHSSGATDAADASAEYDAISWRGGGSTSLSQVRSVVLIDDVFASGRTAAAAWAHLLDLDLSEEATFVVAVPLFVPSKPRDSLFGADVIAATRAIVSGMDE